MSKLLEASCIAGVVTSEGVPVPSAEILSQGIGASTGFLILDGDKAYYVAKTSPDLDTTLGKVITALQQVVVALGILDAKPIGTLAPAPGAAVSIGLVTAAATELTALKASLK